MVKAIKLIFNATITFFTGIIIFYVFFYFVRFWISMQGEEAAQQMQGSTFYMFLKLVPSILIAIYVLFVGVMVYYTLKESKKKKEKRFGRVI